MKVPKAGQPDAVAGWPAAGYGAAGTGGFCAAGAVGGTGLPGYYTGHYVFHADGLKGVLAASSGAASRSGPAEQRPRAMGKKVGLL